MEEHLHKKTEATINRNFSGCIVMDYAAFTQTNETPICFSYTRMNSDSYLQVQLLETLLIDFGEKMHSQYIIF